MFVASTALHDATAGVARRLESQAAGRLEAAVLVARDAKTVGDARLNYVEACERNIWATAIDRAGTSRQAIQSSLYLTRRKVFRAIMNSWNTAEVEYELGFTSVLHPSEELLQAGLEKQLECTACSNTVLPPVLQCRKGHLYCKECKPPSNCCR